MRGMEIDKDLLDILNQSDARRSLSGLRRALSVSRANISRLRSNQTFSVEELTQNLEDVAQAGLRVENGLQSLKQINKRDIRIRLLTDLVVMLDQEKKALANRLNKALADYNEIESDIASGSSLLTRRKVLKPLSQNDGVTAPGRYTGRSGKSTFGRIDFNPSIGFSSGGLGSSGFLPQPRSRTRQRITGGGDGQIPSLPSNFLKQSITIDRENSRQSREFMENQTQFQNDSQRKIERKLDIIADLLRSANRRGGPSSGLGLPDLPDLGRGRGKSRRGSFGRRGVSGILKGSIGAIIADQFLNKENTTGTGSALGGLAGSALGPLGGALGAYIGNDIEESLNAKGKEAQRKRVEDKLNDQQNQLSDSDKAGIAGRIRNFRNFLTGKTSAADFFSGSSMAAIAAQEDAKRRFREMQNNTVPRYSAEQGNVPVVTDSTKIDAKPETNIFIKTDRLVLGGNVGGLGGGISSTDTTFGGAGMGSGGFGTGGGGGGGIVGGNTPSLVPNVRSGLGQTPSQAQSDALQRLEQSKMPQYNPQMSPNSAAGGGPMVMPEGLGGSTPNGVTGLPFTSGGAEGSSNLKNSKGTSISTADTNMPAHQRALLDTVSRYESNGAGQGYNTIVGGGSFEGNQHPNKVGVVTAYGPSTAAGRYQFTKTTWDSTVADYNKKNPNNPITDFSPANQDRAAYYLAQQDYARRTGRNLDEDLKNGKTDLIQQGLGGSGANTTWQGFQGKADVEQTYADALKRNNGYAANSILNKLDPNALPNTGVGSAPRAALGDVIGGATQGAPGSSMFATVGPNNGASYPAGSVPTPSVKELQGSEASIRRQPIQANLREQLQYAAEKTGLQVEIGSGGQAAKGTGGPRTGSTRHDDGGAADLDLYTTDTNGNRRKLDMRNPEDQAKMQAFATEAVRAGATGIGAGLGYMGPSRMHIGGGDINSWGGAPWIADAHKEGIKGQAQGKQDFEAWRAGKIEQNNGGIANPNAQGPTMPEGPGIPNFSNTAPADQPRTLGGMMQAYAKANEIDLNEARKQPSPGEIADQNNAAKMLVDTLNNKQPYNPLAKLGEPTAIEKMLENKSNAINVMPEGYLGEGNENKPRTLGSNSSFYEELLNGTLPEQQKHAAWSEYMKQGEIQPGETFNSWIQRRQALGFNDNLGKAEVETQIDAPYNGKNQAGFNVRQFADELNEDYNNYQGKNSRDRFKQDYARDLDDGTRVQSDKNYENRNRYGVDGPDEYYTEPKNRLTPGELKALYGPNASPSGISPSVSINPTNPDNIASTVGNSEGSTRQSAAPPVEKPPEPAPNTDNSSSKGKQTDSSTSQVTPTGGGDQTEMKQIPTSNDDFGLLILNDKSLSL